MTEILTRLNDAYKSYFLENPGKVSADKRLLERYLLEHNCTFKGQPMPTLLKPNFISEEQSEVLRDHVETMSGALTKFIGLYLESDRVRRIMDFSEREEDLFNIDPGYTNPLVISRLDAFLDETDLKFLEFNCDSPAGIAYADVLEDGFKQIFKGYRFIHDYHIGYSERQDILLDSLLRCYSEFRASKKQMPEVPVIAIIDWPDVSTYSEFELHRAHFMEHGVETLIGAPQDIRVRAGKAYIREREIHLIYKRVITRELVQKFNEVEEFIYSIRKGLVCCCNSFRSYIVGNKKVLSVITDPHFESIFSAGEKELIDHTIPWTRILADSETEFKGEMVRLRSFIPENRNDLVMKPANMYGGKDVYIGRETDPDTWLKVMEDHIEGHSWVVQEYINIPRDDYPESGDSVNFRAKYVNINPFALSGKYAGTITRISDSSVINVSAGGGLVPTLKVLE